jgi:hypothetical protein
MIGYSTVALLFTLTEYEKCWRVGFALLSVFTIITTIFFALSDNQNIDFLHEEKDSKNIPESLNPHAH